jgi:hypothetical protein
MNSSHFTDSRFVDFPQANPFLARILRRYELGLGESPSPSAYIEIRVGLPNGSPLVWDRATSLPRIPLRRQLLRAVSITLQETLRCWLPYLWLSHPDHWMDRDLLWPMLIYASSRTFKPTSRLSYTFDLLNQSTLPAILRSSYPVLREWLPQLQAVNHQRPTVRREFRPNRLDDVMLKSDFDPHPLKRLLAHERRLITLFTEFADSQGDRRGFDHFGFELHRNLCRLYTNVDFSFLAPLLHIEAENTVALHLLERSILENSIAVTPAGPDAKAAPLPRPGFPHHPQPNSRPPVQSV